MAPNHMPDDMVEKIISYLPVKIAARSTLFSRNLTSSWRQNRNLCFIQPEGNQQVELIDNVMSQHNGSKIDKFALRLNAAGHENQVYQWIRIAVAKGVEEMDLDFGGEPTVVISSSLMDSAYSKIGVLKLASCSVDFSGQLNGLRSLKTLSFRYMTIQHSLMRSICESCLALENLEIQNCEFQLRILRIFAGLLENFKTLKVEHFWKSGTVSIYSQTLEEFTYTGVACTIVFEEPVPMTLASASITHLQSHDASCVPVAAELMYAMRNCTNLQICGKTIQGLFPDSPEEQYTHLRWPLYGLKELTLFLNGTNMVTWTGISMITPCDIVYFLRRSSILEKLYIDLGEYPFGWFWRSGAEELFEKWPCQFQSLESLTIKGFKYRSFECQLLRMIVTHSPSLRNVSLFQSTVNGDSSSDRDRQQCLAWMSAQDCSFDVHPPM